MLFLIFYATKVSANSVARGTTYITVLSGPKRVKVLVFVLVKISLLALHQKFHL